MMLKGAYNEYGEDKPSIFRRKMGQNIELKIWGQSSQVKILTKPLCNYFDNSLYIEP